MKSYAVALMSILLIHSTATAQTETRSATLYRCGPDGRDLRDAPCPAGMAEKSGRVHFEAPSAGQQKAARERAADTADEADRMTRERQRREARERREMSGPARIDGLASSPKTQPAKPRAGVKTAKPSRAASASR